MAERSSARARRTRSRRVAYAAARRRLRATWGVRLGWLAQTALLAVQAARADGFPWATWAGSLNLFVWLVVGAYLIWGCKPRYRLLGLAVMPLAAVLLARRVRRRRDGRGDASGYSSLFLVAARRARPRRVRRLHARGRAVGALPLAGAAAEAARGADPARSACPRSSRSTTLAGRTIAFALPALTLGIVGRARPARRRRRRVRRADGGDDRDLGGLRRVLCFSLRGAAGTGARPRTSLLAGFALVIVGPARPPTVTHFS